MSVDSLLATSKKKMGWPNATVWSVMISVGFTK
jgi:hypothetical protein